VYCLVQFQGVSLDQLPRIYLATPVEIALKMRDMAERLGDPVLREQYEWREPETGCLSIEALPASWLFSNQRIEELLFAPMERAIALPAMRRNSGSAEMRARMSEATRETTREAALTA
jgi:hypothetical protein